MKESSLPFVIEAEEVNRLHRASGLGLEDFLATLVEPTRSLARPPISKFNVGAVGLGSSGRVFRGVNIEFPGLPLNFSIHAEQFLVANAARNGEHRLQFLAVSAAPCGHCRQFLQELHGASDIRVLIVDEKSETQPLSHLLPDRFGPQDLLEDDFPLLLETQQNDLRLPSLRTLGLSKPLSLHSVSSSAHTPPSALEVARTRLLAVNPPIQELNGFTLACTSKDDEEAQQLIELRKVSLEAANSSYAPYTNSPSGIAFLTTSGSIYGGPYFESAAYNPSLPPLQTAIVAFVAEGGGDFDEISKVVLVEKEGAAVKQAAFVRFGLEKISPKASYFVFEAQSQPQGGLPS